MLLVRYRRPALRCLAPTPTYAPASSGSKPALILAFISNDFFQEFMRTCIKKVQEQAPVAPATPAVEARDNTNKFLKL